MLQQSHVTTLKSFITIIMCYTFLNCCFRCVLKGCLIYCMLIDFRTGIHDWISVWEWKCQATILLRLVSVRFDHAWNNFSCHRKNTSGEILCKLLHSLWSVFMNLIKYFFVILGLCKASVISLWHWDFEYVLLAIIRLNWSVLKVIDVLIFDICYWQKLHELDDYTVLLNMRLKSEKTRIAANFAAAMESREGRHSMKLNIQRSPFGIKHLHSFHPHFECVNYALLDWISQNECLFCSVFLESEFFSRIFTPMITIC